MVSRGLTKGGLGVGTKCEIDIFKNKFIKCCNTKLFFFFAFDTKHYTHYTYKMFNHRT